MARLTGTTVVVDSDGMPVLLREGDPLPEWAVGKVGEHLLDELDPGGGMRPEPPPKAGSGSSTDAWRSYARDVLNLDVDDDAERAEIIDAVEQALKAPDDA